MVHHAIVSSGHSRPQRVDMTNDESFENLAGSLVAGILWTSLSPSWAFAYLAIAMAVAFVILLVSRHQPAVVLIGRELTLWDPKDLPTVPTAGNHQTSAPASALLNAAGSSQRQCRQI